MVQMNYIDKISHTTVGKILKENSLKPHLVEKWHTDRNAMQKGVDWQFTTDDARIKLKHLYPIVTF